MTRYKDGQGRVLGEGSDMPVDGSIATQAEIDSDDLMRAEALKPKVVSMRQARLALLQSGLLAIVDSAILSGTDEAMKIEWEYSQEVHRDWQSLILLSQSLGLTSLQLDDLFSLASTL